MSDVDMEVARAQITGELAGLIYEDLARLETLVQNKASAEEIRTEMTRWDERQQRKWALISRYQSLGTVELENLMYLELKRLFMANMALQSQGAAPVEAPQAQKLQEKTDGNQ